MQFLKTLCVGVKLIWLQFLVAFSCTYEILKEKSENKVTLYTTGKYMQTFFLYHSTMTLVFTLWRLTQLSFRATK